MSDKVFIYTFENEFSIFQINSKNPEILKLLVSDSTGNEFAVLVERDLFPETDDIFLLWECAKTGQKIQMQITESTKPNATVYRLEAMKIIDNQ